MEIDFSLVNLKNKLIDLRLPSDYNNNHINESINIPRLKLLEEPSLYLSKKQVYYLICDEGIVSKSTCKILNALGYNCYSIKGGINGINK